MKNYSISGFVLILVLLLTGCSKDQLSPEIPEGIEASHQKHPTSLKVKNNAPGGPFFDLETAPNGDILVADASRGITDLSGNLEAVLPGVNNVSTVGRGNMWATTGPSGEVTYDDNQRLYRVYKNRVEVVANLFQFEATYNPDGADINSNPFSVKALNGNEALVIDAGANDLLRINNKGNIEVVAIFPAEVVSTENIKSLVGCPGSGADLCGLPPRMPAQPVPTSIVIGPDGYYYVGELKGISCTRR